jgi:glutathione S-transferase
MSLVVLGASVSPFVRKVRTFLSEKGVAYELDPVNPFTPPEGWRAVSPLGKIPALRDGERTLADSSVICAYLERRFPSPALYPSDPYEYGRALWFEEFMDGGVVPVVGPKVFMPLVLAPLFSGKPVDAAAEATAQQTVETDLAKFWEYLERELGEREYFVGSKLSIADIAVACPHVNLRHAGVAPERKRFPRLRGFVDRMLGRPSLKALVDEETPAFGKRAERIRD